jgi:glycosyltransferase involved in cell wall biosynthesis
MLKISIVTPSFNQAKYLEECLLSVKEQGYPNVEHIVLDGGSTDGSVDILRKYAARMGWSHLQWASERDRGQGDALNKGFQRAQGDIIGWLNSDDFYLKDCFKHVVGAFQGEPRPDVVYGDYIWINEISGIYQVRREISFSGFVLLHNRVNYICSSGGLFIARRIIDDGYLLDPDYYMAMDYEYYLRLFRGGYRFSHSPQIMGALRLHESCKTATHYDSAIEEIERARRASLKELGVLPFGRSQEMYLTLLRSIATCRRWAEKAIRGYYFSQFQRKEFPTLSKRAPGESDEEYECGRHPTAGDE